MSSRPRSSWRSVFGTALPRAWPNRCAVCHADTRGAAARVCADCVARYAAQRPRCERCAIAVPEGVRECGICLRSPPAWSAARAACDYAYPWDGLLAALKFRGVLDLVPSLAEQVALRVENDPGTPPYALVPVPLSAARLRERGYNQAHLLAARIASRLRLACEPRLVLRVLDTAHQISLPRERRASNMRGAFAIEPQASPAVPGRRFVLVDDVMTTGATLTELARVLLAAGAAEVRVWVVARTPE